MRLMLEKIFKALAYISVFINIYYYLLFIVVFNSNTSDQQQIEIFSSYFPLIPPVNNLLYLVIYTLMSIVIFGVYNYKFSALIKIITVLQSVFMFLFLWQLL